LKFIDGEVSSRDGVNVRAHLETCWSCRLTLEQTQETISAFVEFRQQIQIPLTQTPPGNWSGFDRKLNALAASIPDSSESWWLRSRARFGGYFNFTSVSAWLGAQKAIAITSVAALLVGILIWQLFVATPISASELLDKSQDFHAARISGVANPVVYQKLKVTRNGVSEIQ